MASIAIVATYLRFSLHMSEDSEFLWGEFAATLILVAGGVVSACLCRQW